MRGLGHRVEHPSQVGDWLARRPISDLVGVGSPAATSRDWRHLSFDVLDQQDSNTCVAHSGAEALYMRGQAAKIRGEGDAIPRPSIAQGYIFGQLEDQRLEGVHVEQRKILDIGMRARSMLAAWSEYGVASEQRWPFSVAELRALVAAPSMREASKLIPFDIDIASADAHLTGWRRMNNATMADEAARALDRAHFPIIAIKVFQNFASWTGRETYREPEGSYLGNHMMIAVAFRPGETCFKNSWGRTWGESGYAWIANEFLNSHYTLDGWILSAAPPLH